MSTFTGHSYRNLDAKGRLMLPPDFREIAASRSPEGALMLTNFDGCVAGYPLPEWEGIAESFNQLNVLDTRLRNLQRFFIAAAVKVAPDKQGRILIPPHLREYAGLGREVVMAGVGRRLEIWNKEIFEARFRDVEASFDEDMAALAEKGFELKL